MEGQNPQTDLTMKAEISLYYDLYVPPGIHTPAPMLIAVHGYGAHKRYMMREARSVAGERFVIASIQGPHQHYHRTKDGGYRVGFGWLSDHKPEEYVSLHHHFVLDVIDKLAADGLIDRERIALFGFSQACALNFRFAFSNPKVMRAIVGVCGGIPGDFDTNEDYWPRMVGEMFYLFGDDDEFYTQEQFAKFDQTLAAAVPNYRSKHYTAKHEITDEMRADIREFLAGI